MKLHRTEYIITAFASPAKGPGWANSPLWVIIGDRATGKMREECIQPKDFTPEIHTLYKVAAEVQAALVLAVKRRKK